MQTAFFEGDFMTIVIAFLCSDGIVIAADSMLTPSVNGISVGHHKGKKVDILDSEQIFAFAGDHGQANRFKFIAEKCKGRSDSYENAFEFTIAISAEILGNFNDTGIADLVDVNTALGFAHNGKYDCCIFEGNLQPRLLDANHYFAALGSGKMSADPFLRFLVDTFCQSSPPTVRLALLMSVWTIQHVIETTPGGVSGPIRAAKLTQDSGQTKCHELTEREIEDHRQAMESAIGALRNWYNSPMMPGNIHDTPSMPEPPPE
ncbi:hypothetical protein F1643_00645 [Azospirillum sp. INR13]|uniref:hypothetical protein n=1 Tax=Azospirillum sp. INR13 TaxID=2596919 RepID=UPI0018923A29|nr:hypothetical protein [Azospirillum sp. INR13]MBF5093191.1 hypothetical protein [Azospirillum sp. INR13]